MALAIKLQLRPDVHKSQVVKIKPEQKRSTSKEDAKQDGNPIFSWNIRKSLRAHPHGKSYRLGPLALNQSQSKPLLIQLTNKLEKEDSLFGLSINHQQVRPTFINCSHFLLAHPWPFPRNRGAATPLMEN